MKFSKWLILAILLLTTHFVRAQDLPYQFKALADKQTCFVFQMDLQSDEWMPLFEPRIAETQPDRNTPLVNVGQLSILNQWKSEQKQWFLKLKNAGVERILVLGQLGELNKNNVTIAFECSTAQQAKSVGQITGYRENQMGRIIVASGFSDSIVEQAKWRTTFSETELDAWKKVLKPTEGYALRATLHFTTDQSRVLLKDTVFASFRSLSVGLNPGSRRSTFRFVAGGPKMLWDLVGQFPKQLSKKLPVTHRALHPLSLQINVQSRKADQLSSGERIEFQSSNDDENFDRYLQAMDEIVGAYLLHRHVGRPVEKLRTVNDALIDFRKTKEWERGENGVSVGKPAYSWRVGILPLLNESAYYLDTKIPWDDDRNQRATQWSPAVYPFNNRASDQPRTQMQLVLGAAWSRKLALEDELVYGLVVNSSLVEPCVWTEPRDVSVEHLLEKMTNSNVPGTWVGLNNGEIAFIPGQDIDLLRRLFETGVAPIELHRLPARDAQQLIPAPKAFLPNPAYDPWEELPLWLRQPLWEAVEVVVSGLTG